MPLLARVYPCRSPLTPGVFPVGAVPFAIGQMLEDSFNMPNTPITEASIQAAKDKMWAKVPARMKTILRKTIILLDKVAGGPEEARRR